MIEAIQGKVKSEPLNRNFSYLDSNTSDNQSDIATVNKKMKNFNFTAVSPSFYEQLNLPETTVLQCIVINELTNEIYASQVITGSDPEGYRLSRFSIEGVYLDSMTLNEGGHGTTFGIENVGQDVYIWSSYGDGNTIPYKLVRYKYVAGASYSNSSTELETLNRFSTEYVITAIDQKNSKVLYRVGTGTIEVRNIDDVKNDVDDVLETMSIPNDLTFLQGMSLDGDHVYWYTGDSNAVNYPSEITLFDISTGETKERVNVDFGKGIDGEFEQFFFEPEGIYLYTDTKTGAKSLFAGMVTGEEKRRINKIYAYHSLGNESKFIGNRNQKVQPHKMMENGGAAKRIAVGTTALSNITAPGHYYFSSVDYDSLTDLPTSADRAGYFLDVSPSNPNNKVIVQTLKRISSVGDFKKFSRQIDQSTNDITDWYPEPYGGELIWKDLSLQNGATNESGYPLQYAINGTTIYIRGRVNIPSTDGVLFANVPNEARPKQATYVNLSVAGTTGFRKVMVDSLGDMKAYGIMANIPENVTYVYVDWVYPK